MKYPLFSTGALCLLPAFAVANPDVTSREYKIMLEPTLFASNTEVNNVDDYFDDVKVLLENRLDRDVNGSLSLDKVRTVKFYDTAGSCELSQLGYIFRERIESGDSEVTLKFRSPDRYISDFEDLSGSSSQAETKLEADISSKPNNSFSVVYSHSTTEPNTQTINNFADINSHFPGFDDDYGFSDNQNLALVGNLAIYERVYKGAEIDLGSFDGELSLTLWYTGTPSGSQQPLVAEVSFKYEDSSADYSKKVVNRAKVAFAALQELTDWNAASGAPSKTQFVYGYNPNFCN